MGPKTYTGPGHRSGQDTDGDTVMRGYLRLLVACGVIAGACLSPALTQQALAQDISIYPAQNQTQNPGQIPSQEMGQEMGQDTSDQDVDLGLNGQWRRVEDQMVLRIAGGTGDFLNDSRPEWSDEAPTFRDITPVKPGRWTARSQEQRISTGEVFETSCVLNAIGSTAFIATCQGRYNIYRNQYDRMDDDLTV